MRLHLSLFAARVELDNVLGIQGDFLKGVDGDQDDARVCVDGELGVSFPDCVEDGWFVYEGEVSEIIDTFEDWGIPQVWKGLVRAGVQDTKGGLHCAVLVKAY